MTPYTGNLPYTLPSPCSLLLQLALYPRKMTCRRGLNRFYSPLVFSQAWPTGSLAWDGRREQHEAKVPIHSAPSRSVIAGSFHHGPLPCQGGRFTSLQGPSSTPCPCSFSLRANNSPTAPSSKPPLWFPYTLSSSCK